MTPKQVERLEKSLGRVAREQGLDQERLRRWVSFLALCGVLESAVEKSVIDIYYLKGGVAMELRFEAVTKFSFRFPTGRGPGFLGRRVAARTSIVGGGDHGEGTKNPTPWSRATAARLCQ